MLRRLQPRSRSPYDFVSPRAVFISAVCARTRLARARITVRSACACALGCFTGDSNCGSIGASRARVLASKPIVSFYSKFSWSLPSQCYSSSSPVSFISGASSASITWEHTAHRPETGLLVPSATIKSTCHSAPEKRTLAIAKPSLTSSGEIPPRG